MPSVDKGFDVWCLGFGVGIGVGVGVGGGFTCSPSLDHTAAKTLSMFVDFFANVNKSDD